DIGYASFFECTSLQSINIPAAVTKIEVGAFEGCDALNAVHITDLDAWCHIEFETFFHQHPHFDEGASPVRYAKNLYLNGELVTEVVVPDDVTALSGSVFAGWESLQKVTLPEGLKTIGQAAFLGCTALTELRIPASVENVEVYAFGDCTSLERLYIESPVLIESKQNSFTYEAIWKDVADRILVPDTYGETDVGMIFDGCTYEGKQDGYSVFETRKQDGYPIIEGCKHTNLDVREDTCSWFTKCLDCGFVLRDFQQHGPVRWKVVKEPTYDEEGLKEFLCVDCGAWFGDQVIPRLEKPEESSEPEESSVEESSEQTEPSAEESIVSTFSAESSSMASLTETSVPADDTEFPVGIVIIVLLVLAAVGVSVWVVRKKL
ncbi:MAG: leucine-rich repeat domain-containing protein, partial [Clostridia bacterium]|nr:leucine-rich repeat domain-containing protein [Clostridia bacterium]